MAGRSAERPVASVTDVVSESARRGFWLGSLRAPRSVALAATAANEQGAACCWAHSLRPWCPFAAGLLVFLHGDGSYAVTDVGDVKRRRGGRRRRVVTPSAARGAAAAARPMIADGDQLMGVVAW